MKVVIATCFKSNEERVEFVAETFRNRGDEVEIITTSFDHIKKKLRNDLPDGYHYVYTQKYKRNISIKRLLSHNQFATDLFFMIDDLKPDLIWLMAPANSLIMRANKYKKKYKDVRIILDIIDMWPESLPTRINKDLLPFKLWKNRRSKYINCADALVSECDYYKDILSKEYNKDITTIHWCRNEDSMNTQLDLPKDKLSLLYLGSINNIIDVDKIKTIIKNINTPVELHVIGEGENRKHFVDELSKICEVNYHGEIRDLYNKLEIVRHCHAGLNIYKDNLYIGLTVKSIDYMQYGLPIINNIKGDTWDFINDYKVGFNVNEDSRLNSIDIIDMRLNNKHIFDLYNSKFTKDVFNKECNKVIDEVLR